jgi:hypothetical protein
MASETERVVKDESYFSLRLVSPDGLEWVIPMHAIRDSVFVGTAAAYDTLHALEGRHGLTIETWGAIGDAAMTARQPEEFRLRGRGPSGVVAGWQWKIEEEARGGK